MRKRKGFSINLQLYEGALSKCKAKVHVIKIGITILKEKVNKRLGRQKVNG